MSEAPSTANQPAEWLDEIAWNEQGLVPAVAQDENTGRILMVAWMNRQALSETLASGQAVYWSRSRSRLWRKGEESGHSQAVIELRLDCDADVLLLKVRQAGGIACHTGRQSCFFRRLDDGRWVVSDPVLRDPAQIYASTDTAAAAGNSQAAAPRSAGLTGSQAPVAVVTTAAPASVQGDATLDKLAQVIESRRGGDPDKSYVARLLSRGPDAFLKKIGEEATETVMAAKDGEPAKIVAETADLWFHSMIMLAYYGLKPEHVLAELRRREGLSGLDEKAARKAQGRSQTGD